MSEITKACQSCGGRGCYGDELLGVHKYPCCDNGRVPDVEAALRAEVARLAESNANLAKQLQAQKDKTWAALEDQLKQRKRADYAEDDGRMLRDEASRLTATLAERDGEVVRLEGREKTAKEFLRAGEFTGYHNSGPQCPECERSERHSDYGHYPHCARAAWLAGCKS